MNFSIKYKFELFNSFSRLMQILIYVAIQAVNTEEKYSTFYGRRMPRLKRTTLVRER